MNLKVFTAQALGIIAMFFSILSFQEKNNKKFFVKQGLSGLLFFLNFILINAYSAAFFNLTNLVRGVLYSKNNRKLWKLITVLLLYTICFTVTLVFIINNPKQIFLSSITFATLQLMSYLMWRGNGKHIRYGQFFASSPSWIIHNIFNFSLGGILCEVFGMASVIISFIRYGKDGFEK